MAYSRTQKYQKTRKRRVRKLLVVNLTLLVLILAGGGLLLAKWSGSGGGNAGLTASRPPGASASPAGSGDASQPANASAGATGDASQPPSASPSDAAGGGTPSASGQPGPDPSQPQIKLAFVGDILTASTVGDLIDKNGVDYPFEGSAETLKSADITAGNLETPITERGTPAENKTYVYRGKPEYLAGLKNAGFDVLTLANNHTLDQGWEGLSDTMDALDDAGLQHVGSGVDAAEAFTPAIIESNGISVAYIGVSNVVPDGSWKAGPDHPGVADSYDTRPAVAAIQAAKKLADVVVVMVHWGNERAQQPKQAQFDAGRAFIDAGADLVIGSHPHVLQGFEYYKGKWIAYSLGNFIFTQNGNTLAQQTGVLTASCGKDGGCGLTFEPMFLEYGQPSPMKPAEGEQLLATLSQLSYGAAVDERGNVVPSSAGGGKESP